MKEQLFWDNDGTPVTAGMRTGATPEDYRAAVSGSGRFPFGSLEYDWRDKPHRLVYDLAGEVKRLQAENARLAAEKDEALIGLEAQGWPCRLVELPAKYGELRNEVIRLEEALKQIRRIRVADGYGWQNTRALHEIGEVADRALKGKP